ncbi:hypothetical protein H0H81_009086, partial [Sphagnurus paluster]
MMSLLLTRNPLLSNQAFLVISGNLSPSTLLTGSFPKCSVKSVGFGWSIQVMLTMSLFFHWAS